MIGAGPSGLATVKELLDEGHDPVCFERAGSLGGVFRPDGVSWETVELTSSATLTSFSDFPVPPGTGHLTAPEYLEYLFAYAAAFRVEEHIRFGAAVEAVTRRPDGRWDVRVTSGGITETHAFDAVAVCSGLNQNAHVPDVPGLESFPGVVVHASAYRGPELFRGRSVLVVGAGESGADIAAEAAEHARSASISMRRGVAVRPRTYRGLPNDFQVSRLNHSPPDWIYQTRNPKDAPRRRAYRSAFWPLLVVERALQALSRAVYGTLPIVDPMRLARGGREAIDEARVQLRVRRLRAQLLQESGGRVLEQFGTKSDAFLRDVATGRLQRVGAIERFEGARVTFEDGSSSEPDVVVFCTGFTPKTPVLEPTTGQAPRYLHTFDPAVGPDLALIGLVRPGHGAVPPLAELQARWFALVQSGAVRLPPEAEMRARAERDAERRRQFFRALDARRLVVDYTSTCDALAAEIGCKPTTVAVERESRRFRLRFHASPFVAAQYRLVGPHARPELARSVIEDLPIVHPVPMLAVYYLHLRLARVLQRRHGSAFAPKLELDRV